MPTCAPLNVPAMEAFGMTETGPCLYVPLECERDDRLGLAAFCPVSRCRVVDDQAWTASRRSRRTGCPWPGHHGRYYRKPEANRGSRLR